MVSLGTHQDDGCGACEPTVDGAGPRDAQGDRGRRAMGGQGAGSPEETTSATRGKQTSPRTALPVTRPRGREQSVLMRGIMAMRAAEAGSGKRLPQGGVRAEAL